MRTTVRLNESLLTAAKEEARRRGTTLTALIEDGLRLALCPPPPPAKRITLPVSKEGGGAFPGIDLDRTSALEDDLRYFQ